MPEVGSAVAPASYNSDICGYGSRIALAALACPGRRGLIQAAEKFSRRGVRPSCASSHPRKSRGRREDRVRAAPAVSRAIAHSKNAHEHTGSAETLRPSLRSGLTAYFALSPVTGLSCHRHLRHLRHTLSASVGAPGPHDFAVRSSHARQSLLSRPPHLTARS